MEEIRLGKTNLLVKRVGFGGIPIQRVTQEDVNKIVDVLIENNVNLIDTARGYTVSEEYLGNALVGKRDKFVLCTKSMARTYEGMKNDIEISLKNLRTDYIDIYQLHNVKTEEEYELVMGADGAYKALLEAKASGKIGYIGITSHSMDFLDSIIEKCPFATIQFPFNIIETKAEKLLKKAVRQNIGVIAMKPMAGGALDNKKLAIKFLLNQDFISVMIPGMASVEEVLENTSVKKEELTNQEKKEIDNIRKELGNDFCRRCGYCLPCTKGIDIPSCFMFEGYYKRYGLEEWAKSRYEAMSHHASECIECGKCLEKCPYKLNIVNKLKEVAKTFGK